MSGVNEQIDFFGQRAKKGRSKKAELSVDPRGVKA